jgi:hypothetical protein
MGCDQRMWGLKGVNCDFKEEIAKGVEEGSGRETCSSTS